MNLTSNLQFHTVAKFLKIGTRRNFRQFDMHGSPKIFRLFVCVKYCSYCKCEEMSTVAHT